MVVNVFLFDDFEVMDAFESRWRFLGVYRSISMCVLFLCAGV